LVLQRHPRRQCAPTRKGDEAVGRTTCHDGYETSQTTRKRVEEHFGWAKTVGRIRQTVHRRLRRVDQHFKLTMTASKRAENRPNVGRSSAGSSVVSPDVRALQQIGRHCSVRSVAI